MCSALVHVGYIFYPFSCNVTDVFIKHMAQLTKWTYMYTSHPPSVFNCLHVVKASITYL